MAYTHYPYPVLRCITVKKDTATHHPGYPGRDVQELRIARCQLAPAELHVIHRLADKPVAGWRQEPTDLDLYSVGIQVLPVFQGELGGAGVRERGFRSRGQRLSSRRFAPPGALLLPLYMRQPVVESAQAVYIAGTVNIYQQSDPLQRFEVIVFEFAEHLLSQGLFCRLQWVMGCFRHGLALRGGSRGGFTGLI